MEKQQVYETEFNKLTELFREVEESKRKLAEGLIQDAAFLFAENYSLKEILKKTGMIKIHPDYPDIQKTIPAAKEYRQNLNSYSIVIKSLNNILSKDLIEEDDDDLSEFE